MNGAKRFLAQTELTARVAAMVDGPLGIEGMLLNLAIAAHNERDAVIAFLERRYREMDTEACQILQEIWDDCQKEVSA